MRCLLPTPDEQQQGQFTVQIFNPYTTDVCGQSALILAKRQFARRSLPTGVGSFEQFKPIPFDTPYYVSLTVCSHTTRKLVVDLSVYDTQGQMLVRFGDVEFMLMPPPPPVLWEKAAIYEFANGQARNVFGEAYAAIDALPHRVRLPLPPYLFMHRVTSLVAERDTFKPCSIITEYDIPDDVLYAIDGTIPWSVAVEAGQGILFLLGYLGIDAHLQGRRVYRHLDFGVVFLDHLPRTGQTLQYHIHVRSFVRRRNGLLLFYQFDCFADGKAVMRMEQSCAGFFTDEELHQGRGIMDLPTALADNEPADHDAPFVPLLPCPKTSFDQRDLHALSAGELALCFGDAYNHHGANPSLRLPPPALLMVDRVCLVDPSGGARQRGLVIAEKQIAPDDWYFQCHFKNDPVLPGSLLIDGCAQLVQFYLLFLGMQTRTSNAHFQPIVGMEQRARFRAQIYPTHALLTYHMDVTEVGLTPHPYACATVRLRFENKVAAILNIGVQLADYGN
jgi:3-hydroxymyristoyl/3-hydroxydecanoyl-(acyl carrier protein) dehydratase